MSICWRLHQFIYHYVSQYNSMSMLRKSKGKLQLIEPLKSNKSFVQFNAEGFNPEDDAKNRLIDISSEEIHENIFEQQNNLQNKLKSGKQRVKVKEPKIVIPKYQKNRISVVENFTESHRIWRKKSARVLEESPPSAYRQQYSKNQSSFIIFQNGYLNNFNNQHLAYEEGFNRAQKTRHPRNIMSFIKRKNVANSKQPVLSPNQESQLSHSRIKHRRNLSPTVRITQSCELARDFQSITPIKISTNDQISPQQNFMELKCTNPNFRNKKMSNYIKMRASVVVQREGPN